MRVKRFRDWPIRLKVLAIISGCALLLFVFQSTLNTLVFVSNEQIHMEEILQLQGKPIQGRIDLAECA